MTRITSTVYLIISLLCFSLAIVAILVGCDEKTVDPPILGPASGSGPIGGGETQQIRLTASPSETIPTIGEQIATATITALVQNNIGQSVPDGTAVYWSTTTGTLNSTSQTTSNGSSAVTLTFSQNFTGCSTVTAESGDARDSIQICVSNVTPTPTVTTTPTPSTTFIVSSSASTIADGGTSTITAYAATNGVADTGLQVTFSVSSGGILNPNADSTDANGNAQVIFTGNNTSTGDITATITATTQDGRSGTTTVIVTSGAAPTVTPTPAVALTLGAAPATISCAAGSTSVLTATVTSGGASMQNVLVTFSPASNSEGSLSATSDSTDAAGEAQVTYTTDGSCTSPAPSTTNVTFTATAYGQNASVTIGVTNP